MEAGSTHVSEAIVYMHRQTWVLAFDWLEYFPQVMNTLTPYLIRKGTERAFV